MISNARVALVHDWLTVPGGSEDVFREICDLYPGDIFTSQWDRRRITFVRERNVRTSRLQNLPFALSRHYLYAPMMPEVYRGFDLQAYDVVLSSSHSFAHGVRQRPGAPHICYYHTPARSLWMPEIDGRATTGKLARLKRLIARRLKRLDLIASKNPTHILANSQTTADRIQRFYGRTVDAVIYPPVDTEKWADVSRVSDDAGLLYWGRLIPYKRVDLLIEAVRQSGDRLQIVGEGPERARLEAQASGLTNVHFHGRLSDIELKQIIARARAFVFPAYEDFGIVAVEAMAAGLPVVCYRLGGAAESVTTDHGVHIEQQTPNAVQEALRELGNRTFDPERTRQHAHQFRTARFREEYREFVNRVT